MGEDWKVKVMISDLSTKRLVPLRELQSATGEELRRSRTLLLSVLDRAFKGELGC